MEQNKNKLIIGFFLSILATVALVSASYAWLDMSRIPFVTDVSLSIITENNILIAPDEDGSPGEWDTYLDMSAILNDMVPLKPVTYAGDQFYKVEYGDDGRPAGLSPVSRENINVRYPDGGGGTGADRQAEQEGYMLACDYWLKSEGTATDVMLAKPVATAEGQRGGGTYVVGEPVWDRASLSHVNGGCGAETTIRIGFACTPTDRDGVTTGDTQFYIYEPNADVHIDGTDGYVETLSSQGSLLVDNEHLILQEASSWQEQMPILQDVVIYEFGEFIHNVPMFHLDGIGMVKVTMYIWMEGQDMDCQNIIVSKESKVVANIQFGIDETVDVNSHTGIVPR